MKFVVADVGIVGSYFLEKGGVSVTSAFVHNIHMLKKILIPKHLELEECRVCGFSKTELQHTQLKDNCYF